MAEKISVSAFLDYDPSKRYPAILDPEVDWNGWARPEFDRATLDKVMADIGGVLKEEGGELLVSVPEEWGDQWDPVTRTPEGRYILEGWTWMDERYEKGEAVRAVVKVGGTPVPGRDSFGRRRWSSGRAGWKRPGEERVASGVDVEVEHIGGDTWGWTAVTDSGEFEGTVSFPADERGRADFDWVSPAEDDWEDVEAAVERAVADASAKRAALRRAAGEVPAALTVLGQRLINDMYANPEEYAAMDRAPIAIMAIDQPLVDETFAKIKRGEIGARRASLRRGEVSPTGFCDCVADDEEEEEEKRRKKSSLRRGDDMLRRRNIAVGDLADGLERALGGPRVSYDWRETDDPKTLEVTLQPEAYADKAAAWLRGKARSIYSIESVGDAVERPGGGADIKVTLRVASLRTAKLTDPDTLHWVESVLTNDEYSSDEELREHFVAEGLTEAEADFALAQRDRALRDPLAFSLEPMRDTPEQLQDALRRVERAVTEREAWLEAHGMSPPPGMDYGAPGPPPDEGELEAAQMPPLSDPPTEAEAREWIRHVIEELGVNFHPDTPAADYEDEDGGPSFSPEEAVEFDDSVAAIEAAGHDAVAIASEVMEGELEASREFRRRNLGPRRD